MKRDEAEANRARAAERYEAHCRRRLVDQYIPAIPIGIGFNVVLAGLCAAVGDARAAGSSTCVAACFALTYPLARTDWARRRPHVPIMGIAALSAAGAATLTSVGSSFHVSGWAILLVCWGMGAMQLPLSTGAVAAGMVMQLAVFRVLLHVLGAPPPLSPAIVYGLQLCGGLLALEGSRRLHHRDRALLDEEWELRRREADLRLQEAELSAQGRMREDVARRLVEEHLASARTVEALETLLRERVRFRSRRLAERMQDPAPLLPGGEPSSPLRGAE